MDQLRLEHVQTWSVVQRLLARVHNRLVRRAAESLRKWAEYDGPYQEDEYHARVRKTNTMQATRTLVTGALLLALLLAEPWALGTPFA